MSAARSLNISTNKTSLFGDEESVVIASPSGFTNGELIYIKGAFYQDGCGSNCNYFGYTKNGNTWIKNGDSIIIQRQVKIGDWDNSLTVKSDFTDSGYKGEGDYKLKIGFYYFSSNGNLSTSVNWSSDVLDVHINEPDPTPTDTPTPTNTPTPASNAATTTPTSKPTVTPTLKPSIKPSPTAQSVLVATGTGVLGQSSKSAEIQLPTEAQKEIKIASEKSNNLLPKFLILIGIVFLIACAIVVFYPYLRNLRNKNTDE